MKGTVRHSAGTPCPPGPRPFHPSGPDQMPVATMNVRHCLRILSLAAPKNCVAINDT